MLRAYREILASAGYKSACRRLKSMKVLSLTDLGLVASNDVQNRAVDSAVNRLGYRRANRVELVAYKEKTWNGNDGVCAEATPLGSEAMFILEMPFLKRGGTLRTLFQGCIKPGHYWREDWKFLVVPSHS